MRATRRSCRRRSRSSRSTRDYAGFLFEPVEPDCGRSTPGSAAPRRQRSSRSSRGRRRAIEEALRALAERLGQKPRQAFAPIRLAVTGSKVSPGLFESLELLGRDESLRRLSAPLRRPERLRRRERIERPLERPPRPAPEAEVSGAGDRARGGPCAAAGRRGRDLTF